MSDSSLSFGARLGFAWVCFFRVLFDGEFAARAFRVREPAALPEPEPAPMPETPKPFAPAPNTKPEAASNDAALLILSLLQRDGRFVDFIQQDIATHADADVGAAARVVHEGCRKALAGHVAMTPIRTEAEGAEVVLETGFDPNEVKLTGAVKGSGPYRGILRHPGWRADSVSLPVLVLGHDARVIAAAEVEL